MCGFLGVYGKSGERFAPTEIERFRSKAARLAHRGNTSQGELLENSLALFHYRLAFRGLQDGAQPLSDLSKRATILYNGELYSYSKLREDLAKQYEFHSHADTEVILASYLVHGSENFLAQFDGEYAFAIWDRKSSRLLAARDPLGVKPLFLANENMKRLPADFFREYRDIYEFELSGNLQLASEMKGLPLPLRWDRRGMRRQLFGLYEEINTAFEGVIQLPPGALLQAEQTRGGWKIRIERKIQKRRKHNLTKSFPECAQELKEMIARTVQAKLDSEVPLGAYLSGGIDSRIAAYEMSKAGAEIQSFTVGFQDKDYDETEDVQKFLRAFPNLRGRALKTNKESLIYSYPHAIYASELIQPYTNGGAKWWLSRFARRHVRGVLTGDGADELFCGYPSYRYLAWWKFYQRQPSAARASLYAARVGGKGNKFWEKGLSSREDGRDLKASQNCWGWAHPLFEQIQSMATALLGERDATEWLHGERESLASYTAPDLQESALTQWQNYFLHTHFPTHVLNWVGDRMEMANTLEGRPIFISKEILNFTESLPDHYLVRGMRDKAVLRAAYSKELANFSRSPKKQFNAPFLQEGSIPNTSLFEPSALAKIEKQWREEQNPLQKSYLSMLRQNLIVLQMLDLYLVREQGPERNHEYEEQFLDTHTETL